MKLKKWTYQGGNSPKRTKNGESEPPNFNAEAMAKELYKTIASPATEGLMKFLSRLSDSTDSSRDFCVTYFDETHELEACLWTLLRLLQGQDSLIKMWYVFMGTKSRFSYYAPRPINRQFYCFACMHVTYGFIRTFCEIEKRIHGTAAALCCAWF